jgi:hypothetical protein
MHAIRLGSSCTFIDNLIGEERQTKVSISTRYQKKKEYTKGPTLSISLTTVFR